jgi:hypothetical protein
MCFGTEETSHVLDEDQARTELVNGVGHVRPEAGAGVGTHPGPLAGGADVLAREAPAEHVDRLDLRPVHGGDVAEVGSVGVAVSEHLARAGLDV